jgi:hypothetical protein
MGNTAMKKDLTPPRGNFHRDPPFTHYVHPIRTINPTPSFHFIPNTTALFFGIGISFIGLICFPIPCLYNSPTGHFPLVQKLNVYAFAPLDKIVRHDNSRVRPEIYCRPRGPEGFAVILFDVASEF